MATNTLFKVGDFVLSYPTELSAFVLFAVLVVFAFGLSLLAYMLMVDESIAAGATFLIVVMAIWGLMAKAASGVPDDAPGAWSAHVFALTLQWELLAALCAALGVLIAWLTFIVRDAF